MIINCHATCKSTRRMCHRSLGKEEEVIVMQHAS